MAWAKRSPAYNNGLEKKFDGDVNMNDRSWQPASNMRPWATFRKKRLFLALVVVVLIYLFIKNAPTDVPSAGQRIDPLTGLSQSRMPISLRPVPVDQQSTVGGEMYDGPVKFYRLASTLRNHMYVPGAGKENVVIVLHDLRTTTSLIGLACKIGFHNRVNVHVILLCPQENPIEEIMDISGIQNQDCPIYWHDARPDYNLKSSLNRRITTVQSALSHIHAYIRPATVIVDEQQVRDSRFANALKSRLDQTWTPLSIVPNDALISMSWITTLDSTGLSLLRQIQVDIIISPYENSSGSLIRLLKSIQSAHYGGLPLPRITVEIPSSVDDFALSYLESFRWPSDSPVSQSRLILRRHIDAVKPTASIASIRTLESFYPPSYPLSHVLVLDPNIELSPDYLHYLNYLTLEYKYGIKGKNITDALLGICLGSPADTLDSNHATRPKSSSLLLSQLPGTSATLYFGDKWVELQDYVSLRLQHEPDLAVKISRDPVEKPAKLPSQPAWLDLALEFTRARNYYTLYTNPSSHHGKELITVHTEAFRNPPEVEATLPKRPKSDDNIPPPTLAEDTILSNEAPNENPNPHHPQPIFTSPFLSSHLNKSPGGPDLPEGTDIPLYSHTGDSTDWTESSVSANEYSQQISLQIGGCKSLKDRDEEQRKKSEVAYLFCEVDE